MAYEWPSFLFNEQRLVMKSVVLWVFRL